MAKVAAHALPLVSTIHHSGIPENIMDGETGFLVQENDFVTMGKKIAYLFNNPEMTEEMGKAGRKRIMKLCKTGHRADRFRKLLMNTSNST